MKKIFFALLTIPFLSFGQGSQDFENAGIPSGNNYVDGTFSEGGITYNYFKCRDQDTFNITNHGLMLRRASDSYFEWTIPDGIGNLEFQYRKAFTGAAERELEIIVNSDTITTPGFGAGSGAQDTIYTFSHNFNIQGSVTVKIKNVGAATTNKQTVIDNIVWTAVGGGSGDPDPGNDPECADPEDLFIDNIGETTADLMWEPGEEGQTFEVVYGPAPLDPNSGGQTITLNDPVYTLTNLTPGTNYEVYIRAICGDTTYSDWISGTFTTDVDNTDPGNDEECDAPTDVTVSAITQNSASIGWTPGGTETVWEIHYGKTGDDPSTYTVVTVSDNPFEIQNLDENTEYTVFVVAICDNDEESDASTPVNFTTEKSSDIAKEAFTNLSLYPNPMNDNFNLKADRKIEKVEIYNVLGESIQTIIPNATNVNISTSNLSKGIYLVNVSIDGDNKTYRVIKK